MCWIKVLVGGWMLVFRLGFGSSGLGCREVFWGCLEGRNVFNFKLRIFLDLIGNYLVLEFILFFRWEE